MPPRSVRATRTGTSLTSSCRARTTSRRRGDSAFRGRREALSNESRPPRRSAEPAAADAGPCRVRKAGSRRCRGSRSSSGRRPRRRACRRACRGRATWTEPFGGAPRPRVRRIASVAPPPGPLSGGRQTVIASRAARAYVEAQRQAPHRAGRGELRLDHGGRLPHARTGDAGRARRAGRRAARASRRPRERERQPRRRRPCPPGAAAGSAAPAGTTNVARASGGSRRLRDVEDDGGPPPASGRARRGAAARSAPGRRRSRRPRARRRACRRLRRGPPCGSIAAVPPARAG